MKKWYVLGLFFSFILMVVYTTTIPQATYAKGESIGTAKVELTNCAPKNKPTLCTIKFSVNITFTSQAKFPRNIKYAAYLSDSKGLETKGIFYGPIQKKLDKKGKFQGNTSLSRVELTTLVGKPWRVYIFTTTGAKNGNPIIPESIVAVGNLDVAGSKQGNASVKSLK